MLFTNFVFIYIPGLTQLHLWLSLVKGEAASIYQVLSIGLFPFIAGDVVKVMAAAVAARAIIPKHLNK